MGLNLIISNKANYVPDRGNVLSTQIQSIRVGRSTLVKRKFQKHRIQAPETKREQYAIQKNSRYNTKIEIHLKRSPGAVSNKEVNLKL